MQWRAVSVLPLAVVCFAIGLELPAEAQPLIDHRDVRCISPDQFTQFLARIRPPDVRTAKLYFRSHFYPDFYYVELSVDNGVHHGILPIPNEETRRVVYYIEAIDAGFNTARSEEFVVEVDDRCRPGPDAALFTGNEPGIVVGSTKFGLSAIPPGFRAVGIGGFITAAGAVAAAGGGGIGAGVAVGAALGAAAGVGVVVAQGGEETATTTSVMMTTTVPGSGGGTTTVPGSTTTVGGGGSTTSTSTSTSSSTSTVASTSVPTTTTTSIPLVACFTWSALGNCRVQFDSCSTPLAAIASYKWRMLGPPPNLDIGSTTSFTFDFTPHDPRCTGSMTFNRPIRLTVFDADGNFAEMQQNVDIIPPATLRTTATEARLRVQVLGAPEASILVFLRGASYPLSGRSGPVELRAPLDESPAGYDLEAHVIEGVEEGALLVFELAAPLRASHVSLGRVESRGEGRIAFRLSWNGETVRFRLSSVDLTERR